MGGTFHFLFKEQQYLQEIITTPIFLDILKLDHLNINEDFILSLLCRSVAQTWAVRS